MHSNGGNFLRFFSKVIGLKPISQHGKFCTSTDPAFVMAFRFFTISKFPSINIYQVRVENKRFLLILS